MNENLDLTTILKDCPKGTKLYSPLIGYCELRSVNEKGDYPIQVLPCNTTFYCYFTKHGIYDLGYPNTECLLFPSKDNRDWTTFKAPIKLPKSWEEFCENHPIKENECYIDSFSSIDSFKNTTKTKRDFIEDKGVLPNKEYAEAMLALCQLIQLRDCYNDGWVVDWRDVYQNKYCIYYHSNNIVCDIRYDEQCVLSFKTPELRDEFLKNFRALIEAAKPLL